MIVVFLCCFGEISASNKHPFASCFYAPYTLLFIFLFWSLLKPAFSRNLHDVGLFSTGPVKLPLLIKVADVDGRNFAGWTLKLVAVHGLAIWYEFPSFSGLVLGVKIALSNAFRKNVHICMVITI